MNGAGQLAAWQLRPRILRLDPGGEKYLPFAKQQLLRMYLANVYGIREITMPDGAVVRYRRQPGHNSDWISIAVENGAFAHGYTSADQTYVGVLNSAGDFVWKTRIDHPGGTAEVYPLLASKTGATILVSNTDSGTGGIFAVTSSGIVQLSALDGLEPGPLTGPFVREGLGLDVSGKHVAYTANGTQSFTLGSSGYQAGLFFYRRIGYTKLGQTPIEKAWEEHAPFFSGLVSLGISSWVSAGGSISFLGTTTTGYDLTVASITSVTTNPRVVGPSDARYFFPSQRAVTPTEASPGLPVFLQTVASAVSADYGAGVVGVEMKTCIWRMKNGVVSLVDSRTGSGTFTLRYISFNVKQRGWDAATLYGGPAVLVETSPFSSSFPVGANPAVGATPDGRCVAIWPRTQYTTPGTFGSPSNVMNVDQLEVSVDGVLKGTIPITTGAVINTSFAILFVRNDTVVFTYNAFTASFTSVRVVYEVSLSTGAVVRSIAVDNLFAGVGDKGTNYLFAIDNSATVFNVYGKVPYKLLGTTPFDGDNVVSAPSSWDNKSGPYYVLRPASDYDIRAFAVVAPVPPETGYTITNLAFATAFNDKDLPDTSDPPVDIPHTQTLTVPLILDGVQ